MWKRRCLNYENDISAEEEIKVQGSRIQIQNEHGRRKKGFSCQKSKGQKSIVRIRIAARRAPRESTGAVLQQSFFLLRTVNNSFSSVFVKEEKNHDIFGILKKQRGF